VSQVRGAVQKTQEAAVHSKPKDTGRIWLWGFLAVIALAQLYVVRELLAALAIFTLGFAALAFVVASLYMLQKSWELAVARLAALRHPVMTMASVNRENQKAA
jgi:CHASE2 domain-containing sensor protein